ncbi:hypothetical protein [Winogradskyella sp.]|nr:hypothetical protein [Winogradskyella sp.]
MGFEFTSGHHCSWKKYAEGYRPKINGNKVSFPVFICIVFLRTHAVRY